MHAVAAFPAVALAGGAVLGIQAGAPPGGHWLPVSLAAVAAVLWIGRKPWGAVAALIAGFAAAGLCLGASAAADALHTPLRMVLDEAVGGFLIDQVEAVSAHEPIATRVRLDEDAVVRDGNVSVRGTVESVRIRGRDIPAQGGVVVAVAGASAAARAPAWRAGRVVTAPVTFRRPARYLTSGVADGERASALAGVSLLARVKSGLLVDVVASGGWFAEHAAGARAAVRERVVRHMAGRAASGAAIVTALLIGDRTAIPPEVRARLQAAGTYHVIAISGGNVAVLVVLVVVAARACGLSGRLASGVAVPLLVLYAAGISSGPSVWRAVATAVAYLTARAADHRTPPWNAMAVSAAVQASATPLEVVAPGFWLTYGATGALLLGLGRRHPERAKTPRPWWSHPVRWAVTAVGASLAVELFIAPVTIVAFSRVTLAGPLLNLVAVPAMTVAQVTGLGMVMGGWEWAARWLGRIAGVCTDLLAGTARLVDWFPWLAPRVSPRSLVLLAAGGVAVALVWRVRPRWRAAVSAGALLVWVVVPAPGSIRHREGWLTLTAFDVGQGESLLLQLPGSGTVLVDAGGGGAAGGDIGERVLAPALWARGIRMLDTLAVTHADPDHIGGALSLLRDFRPAHLWTGITVGGHRESAALDEAAQRVGTMARALAAGATVGAGGVTIRVLHPPVADWDRPWVRNDDSLVLEVRYGEAALLLTGDIGADVERQLIPRLQPARLRVLKAAHHGSRTSTSRLLLDAWRPQVAVISCGRGNPFGHPAREVLSRLEAAGAAVLRTDRDGEVTIDTDGRELSYRTWRRPVAVVVHEGREPGIVPAPSN